MKVIRSDEYLKFALQFTKEEKKLRDFFMQWLPERIIDWHVHNGHPDFVGEIDDFIWNHPACSFSDFTIEQSSGIREKFYPGKKVSMLRFAMPFDGVDRRKLNYHLIRDCPPEDRIALYGIPTDIKYTVGMMSFFYVRVSALKMYRSFFVPPAKKIYQFFPKEILEEAQSRGVPIILHLPNTASNCVGEREQLICDFPELFVVLAHLRIYTEPLDDLEEAYSSFSKSEMVRVDTSMVFSSEVLTLVLNYFGDERILYGSDEPLNLLRADVYQHPILGVRIMSDYPYHWIAKKEYLQFRHLVGNPIHAYWRSLTAIRDAISFLSEERQEVAKKRIFFSNSKQSFIGG